MGVAEIPSDEARRVAALYAYDILDTPAEHAFDAIAKLTATILDVPIALVSLVDRDRQWCKARYGRQAVQAPREATFCAHVVAERGPLVVPDTIEDERFHDNPLVLGDPRVRFYAGMPLATPEGYVLGALCALDHAPREATPAQIEALGLLADQVIALLELRRTSRLLREERRKLDTVFDDLVEGVVLQDTRGEILHHNRAAETILGLSRDQLVGVSSLDPRWRATHADGSPFPGVDHPSMVALRTGQVQSDVVMCIHKPSGEPGWLSINSRPLARPGEDAPYAVVSTFRDITEQREISDRLAHHQRLVTAGTLAAGVGHEINNPLSYLMTNLGLAVEELGAFAGGSPSRRLTEIIGMLEVAQEGGERVKRIVRGLKALAREDTELVPTDLNAIVRNALQTASHELRTQATVHLELGSVALVLGDESRLSQVLINLLVNAAQAFSTANPSVNCIVVRTRRERDVIVEVIDNGPGIPAAVLPRIFDPFFTTKQVGVGTGLGLAISHGIVTALGGTLACETREGHGTTFRIALPVAEPAPVTGPHEIAVPALGRLLVVDDERAILNTITRVFRADYEVFCFDDPREALRHVQDGADFDLVLCDLSMPYMSGMELHTAIAAIRPALADRIVFISGDLTRDDIREFLARVPNERLEKPISLEQLRALAKRG